MQRSLPTNVTGFVRRFQTTRLIAGLLISVTCFYVYLAIWSFSDALAFEHQRLYQYLSGQLYDHGLFAFDQKDTFVLTPDPLRPITYGQMKVAGFASRSLTILPGLFLSLWVFRLFLIRGRPSWLRCFECEYDLRGTTMDLCPECGTKVPPGQKQIILMFSEEAEK